MVDTERTEAELLAIFADGQNAGSLTAQDIRDLIISTVNKDAKSDAAHGIMDYNDTATSGTPIVIASDTPVLLTNNGLGAFTNKTYAPEGVTDLWDVNIDAFDWLELTLGSVVRIRVDVIVTTDFNNTDLNIRLNLGSGGGSYQIPIVRESIKSASTIQISSFRMIYMGDNNTLNNGGTLEIEMDNTGEVVVNGWALDITRRLI